MSCTSVLNAHLIFYCTKQKCTNVLVSMKSAALSGRIYRTNKTMTSPNHVILPVDCRGPPLLTFPFHSQNELYQKSVPFSKFS